MGKQINYWMGYEDFLPVAMAALDSGCVIIKKSANGELIHGQTLDIVTEKESHYWFFRREDEAEKLPTIKECMLGYTSSGNVLIEASYSFRDDAKRELRRSRLYVISGFYDDNGVYIEMPERIRKIYERLVRAVKKATPYTELIDTLISARDEDYLQPREWKHKEYVSPSFLRLKLEEKYRLC